MAWYMAETDPAAAHVDTERIALTANPTAVRTALSDLRARWRRTRLDPALGDRAEQVLAEVLNNIVEHALAGCRNGVIRLCVAHRSGELNVVVRDNGRALPDGALPLGKPACVSGPLDDLPEGGFGWFLIRNLAEDLDYCRDGSWNCLRFRVVAGTATALG